MKKVFFGLLAMTLIAGCSTTKKPEMEDDLKAFLADFKTKLGGPEDEIVKLFTVGEKEKDILLRAINLLQDKDSVLKVQLLLDETKQYTENSYLLVDVPVDLVGEGRSSQRTFFSLYLFRGEGKFHIAKMEADRLFESFWMLRNDVEYAEFAAEVIAQEKPYHDRALELRKGYDSVVWYAIHGNSAYFYAVLGKYNFESLKKGSLQDCKMGLIDSKGQIVVPAEYDLIGNPSIVLPEMVEVTSHGKVGYFSLDGKQVVPLVYNWLIPYTQGAANALVKKDSIYGWLDKTYQFHEGFPSESAERTINEFQYLTSKPQTFGVGHQDMIKVLYPVDANSSQHTRGLIITPAYLVSLGILPAVSDGFITKRRGLDYQMGNEYSEMKVQKPFSISDILTVLITEVQSRFVGGRSEFYTRQELILVDEKRDVVGSIGVQNGKNFAFKKLNDSLYQCSFSQDFMGFGGNDFREQNVLEYRYFNFNGKKVKQLKSERRFTFTEFVEMDSSYLRGDFSTYDYVTNKQVQHKFLSNATLSFMRAEILAGYGFIFTEPEFKERFKYADWYKPTAASYTEVYAKASAIDKYNLDFIARLIGSYPTSPS